MIFLLVYIELLKFGLAETKCSFPCPTYHSQHNLDCDFYNSSFCYQSENDLLNHTDEKLARQTHLQTKMFDNGNITFTWNVEPTSIEYLQGFLINMTLLDGACKLENTNIVRAYIYTNRSQIEEYKNEPFSLKLARICPRIWKLDLYSLPTTNCSNNTQHQILVLRHKSEIKVNAAGQWKSQMVISYSYPLHHITVNFTKAPDKYNFEYYIISLNEMNSKKFIKSQKINKFAEPFVTFKADFSGKYTVTLQPIESFPNDKNRCLCRSNTNTCTSCSITSSNEVEFIDPCRIRQDPLPPIPASLKLDVIIAVLAFVSIILILSIILKGFFHKSPRKPEKYAILLSLNDHPLHDKAVDYLIQYLEEFGIIVHHAEEFGKCVFEVYDIVLLVNSTALAERQKAWAEEKDYEKFFEEKHSSNLTNEVFILIDELSVGKNKQKIISLKFDYVPDNTVFKHYPLQKGNFSIPNNLFDMIKIMVNTTTKFRGFFKKQALINAINNAAKYENDYKNWFSEKYGEPVSLNFISSSYGEGKAYVKNIDKIFKTNYSIQSCNVSELLQTLQKENDQGILLNLFNKMPSTFDFDFENNSIISV